MKDTRSHRRWIAAALILICAVSLGLRLLPAHRLLPVHTDPDDSFVWTYRWMSGEQVPAHYGVYPTLWPRVLAFACPSTHLPDPHGTLAGHLAAAAAPYLRMRLLMVALAFLSAPVTFLLARRWLGNGWALLSAAFLATSLLHLSDSSLTKSHAAHVTFAWIALVLALDHLERPSVPRALGMAAAAVLAMGTLQTGFLLLPPMALAVWLSRPPSTARTLLTWAAVPGALLLGLVFIPGGLHFVREGLVLGQGHAFIFDLLDGSGVWRWPRLVWEQDPVLTTLALAGFVCALRCSRSWLSEPLARRQALVLLAYTLPILVLVCLDRNVRDRYLLPVYPLFAVAAAFAVRRWTGARRPLWVHVAVSLAVLALPLWIAGRFVWLARRPDTLQQLASWIEAQPDAQAARLLLSPAITPPLLPTAAALEQQLATTSGRAQRWFSYLHGLGEIPACAPGYDLRTIDPRLYNRTSDPARFAANLERERPRWIVLEISPRVFTSKGAEPLIELVRQRGKLVARFPGSGGQINYQGSEPLALRVFSATAFGPPLEVYRWPAP